MKKRNSIYTSIYKTLIYSDVFNSPLTLNDLHSYLYRHKISKKLLRSLLNTCPFVKKIDNYYVLVGREKIVKSQRTKMKESKRKLEIGKKFSTYLSKIPTVLFVGVSGSVAVRNATKEADIDLMIITRSHSLWITRLLVIGLVHFVGRKRAVKVRIAPDTICTNMWVTESTLELTKKNLFTAREIVQMKVLIDKKNTYAKFLYANKWVYQYFPNAGSQIQTTSSMSVLSWVYVLPNILAYVVQRLYMHNKITTEIVTLQYAAFHPKDITRAVLKTYSSRLKTYKLYAQNDSAMTPDKTLITPGS